MSLLRKLMQRKIDYYSQRLKNYKQLMSNRFANNYGESASISYANFVAK